MICVIVNSVLVPTASTKSFGVALNVIKFLVWHKIFGLAQNILGPLEGQGIIVLFLSDKYKVYHFMIDPFLIKKSDFRTIKKSSKDCKS